MVTQLRVPDISYLVPRGFTHLSGLPFLTSIVSCSLWCKVMLEMIAACCEWPIPNDVFVCPSLWLQCHHSREPVWSYM